MAEPLTPEVLDNVALTAKAHSRRFDDIEVSCDLLLALIEAARERDRLRQAVGATLEMLPRVSQLLDGWHQDGTAWSVYDESVRAEVSAVHQRLDALKVLP